MREERVPDTDTRLEVAVKRAVAAVFVLAVVSGFLWLGACASASMDPKLASVCHEMLGSGDPQCQ